MRTVGGIGAIMRPRWTADTVASTEVSGARTGVRHDGTTRVNAQREAIPHAQEASR